MKNLLSLAFLTTILFSCKKEETKADSAKEDFVFTYSYNNATKLDMKNAYWYSSGGRTGIRAGNGLAENLEINWDGDNNTSVGIKEMPASKGFIFYFNDYTYYRDGINSKMEITASANGKMSGTFSYTVKGDNDLIKTVSGNFTNLSKQ